METAHVYILHRKAFTFIVDSAIGLMMMMMMIAQESRAFCCCQSLQGRLPYNADDCFIYTLNRSSYALHLKKRAICRTSYRVRPLNQRSLYQMRYNQVFRRCPSL